MRVSARELVSSAQSSKQPMAVLAGLVTQEQRRLVRWRTFLLLTQTLGRLSVKAGQFSEQSTVEITGLGKQAEQRMISGTSRLPPRIMGRLWVTRARSFVLQMEETLGQANQAGLSILLWGFSLRMLIPEQLW